MGDETSRFAGRKVLVTGAAQGIGEAIARRLARDGAALALLDVQPPGEWQGPPDAAARLHVDLLDREAVIAAVGQAAQAMGGLDGIVNCAGGGGGARTIDALEPDHWERAMALNATAPYLICRAALPWLRQAPGVASIVNVSSGASVLPTGPGSCAYSAAKGALNAFTKALAIDLAPDVRANCVMPGVTNTPLAMRSIIKDYPNPNDAPFVQKFALKRVAEADELANVATFLLSQEASFVTGAIWDATGGRVFH